MKASTDPFDRLLEWVVGIPVETRCSHDRLHDDHDGKFTGILSVIVGDDGDVWVSTDGHRGPPMRFRVPMLGGGMSPRTYVALRVLAVAIALDNKKDPIEMPKRVPKTRRRRKK